MNMEVWNKIKDVPREACKTINAGRLKGMTDINPVWRLKTLTEVFGMVGVGWYYEIIDKRIEDGAAGERVAVVDIALYVKDGEAWSKPIYGTGGSMLVSAERAGLHTSDEAYKMALTDAISVACKALGMGAKVYWSECDKYTKQVPQQTAKPQQVQAKSALTLEHRNGLNKAIQDRAKALNVSIKEVVTMFTALTKRNISDVTDADYDTVLDIIDVLDKNIPPTEREEA